MFRYFWSC